MHLCVTLVDVHYSVCWHDKATSLSRAFVSLYLDFHAFDLIKFIFLYYYNCRCDDTPYVLLFLLFRGSNSLSLFCFTWCHPSSLWTLTFPLHFGRAISTQNFSIESRSTYKPRSWRFQAKKPKFIFVPFCILLFLGPKPLWFSIYLLYYCC